MSLPNDADIYCDESGNSGPNYLDPKQPFYVLGGWVVPHDAAAEAVAAAEETRRRYSPQRPELKSEAFLAGERQKQGALDLFKKLGAVGCVPLFLSAEKRFCVAGKMVETFLDPAYNNSLLNGFTGDVTTKQEIANSLYSLLPDDVHRNFAIAYRNPTSHAFGQSLSEIVSEVRQHINPELADVFEGARQKLKEIAESEADNTVFGKVSATLNLPSLVSFLMLVENLGRLGLIKPTRIMHDEHRVYGEGYEKVFQYHKSIHDWFVRLPHTEVTYASLKHVAKFEMVNSLSEPLIQCADLLAGVINHLCILALCDGPITDMDGELAAATLPALLRGRPQLAWAVWSDQLIGRVGKTCFGKILSAMKQLESTPVDAALTVPSDDPTPLPILPAVGGPQADTRHRYKFEIPVYGFVDVESGHLLVLHTPDDAEAEAKAEGEVALPSVLPLYKRRADAEQFLKKLGTNSYALKEYGPGDIPDLISALEAARSDVNTIVFDPATPRQAHLALPQFLQGLIASFDRVARTFRSGLYQKVVQHHKINGVQFISMLASDGTYVAGSAQGGRITKGKTREEAVRAFINSGSFLSKTRPTRSGKVGRNDPCPCGSGRKYKHCCLTR